MTISSADQMKMKSQSIELLEPRIAPASVSVTYTDFDGDLVKITASKPGSIAPPLDSADLMFVDGDPDGQLKSLVLTDPGFDGTSIKFSVKKRLGGDGLAHVGFINASGVDLNKIIVKGDLGKITAGDSVTANDPGLNLIQAHSMGIFGLFTQGGTGDHFSEINGELITLKVAGDFSDVYLAVTATQTADGQIGSIFVGGDFIGETGFGGQIFGSGEIGKVQIIGNLIGGAQPYSGSISSLGTIGQVRIGGHLSGGTGFWSGSLSGGAMGDVRVDGNVSGSGGESSGHISSSGTMGNVRIGGDLTGSAGRGSGNLQSTGEMGEVRIGGSLAGGAGMDSGVVISHSAMGDVRIDGDVIGSGARTGSILSVGPMGKLRIGGDILGGLGDQSGEVTSYGGIESVRIDGSIIGGTGSQSGLLLSTREIGHIWIGGNVTGGSVAGDASISYSGGIRSDFGRIASVTIIGSLIAGSDNSTGTISHSGEIVAAEDIGPVKIGGSILGNSTHPAQIIAKGQTEKPTSGFDVAIESLTVRGDVHFAEILCGFGINLLPANADASIGAVSIGRDWVASSLVAGAQDAGAPGFGFEDILQSENDTSLIARIASISIKGDVTGSLASSKHFGFVAQQIDKLKVGSRSISLTAGPSNDQHPLPFTTNFHLLEVS